MILSIQNFALKAKIDKIWREIWNNITLFYKNKEFNHINSLGLEWKDTIGFWLFSRELDFIYMMGNLGLLVPKLMGSTPLLCLKSAEKVIIIFWRKVNLLFLTQKYLKEILGTKTEKLGWKDILRRYFSEEQNFPHVAHSRLRQFLTKF